MKRLAPEAFRVGILLSLVIVIGVAATAYFASARRDRKPWSTIQGAFAFQRPFQPRLADVPYGRWTPTRGGRPSPSGAESNIDLRLAAALLEKRALSTPTENDISRAATARLVLDDVDGAIALFERALSASPAHSHVRCDLAAAYLVRAERADSRVDVARAIDAASRSAQGDADNPVCLFNLAIALERAALQAASATTWARAAADTGLWADEARDHAAALAHLETRADRTKSLEIDVLGRDDLSAALPGYADIVGELLERRVLGRWAEAVERADGRGEADTARRAAFLADRLRESTGDEYYGAMVRELTSCRKRCAAGWRMHLDAVQAWEDERFSAMREATRGADEVFGHELSAVNAVRTLARVTIARLDGRGAEAARWLPEFQAYAAAHGFKMLAGRLAWQLGLLASESGDFGRSMSLYRSAIDWLTRAHDREGVALVESLLASKYQQLDDTDAAWRHEFAALAGLSASRPLRHRSILSIASLLSEYSGLESAALVFRAPLVEAARQSGAAINLARFLADDAATFERLGRRDLARDRINEAIKSLDGIDDAGAASMIRALVRIAEGKLLAEDQPRAAAQRLQDAIDIYAARGNTFATPAIELERGRALLKAGETAAAEQAFADGVAAADRERRAVGSDADRIAALAARWDLFANLIDLHIRRNDERGASALLERARAINLIERLAPRGTDPQVSLPPQTIGIEYVALPSGLYGWVYRNNRREGFRISSSIADLRSTVSSYRAAVGQRDHPRIEDLSRRLSRILLGPIGDRLSGVTRALIVPDDVLYGLPFAALPDPVTGRPLVERLAVMMTPAMSFYGIPSGRRPVASIVDALVVGDPDRGNAVADNLPRLPASADEARAVAGMYARPILATGSTATRRQFLDHVENAGVVHFAGHALVSDRQRNRSRLLFAPSSDDPMGAVFASDIENLHLSDVHLVVLSACETAQGQFARGEGMNGLVRAFLAAGAPTVVATLWSIDDAPSAELFRRFHAIWLRGLSAEDALRQAQLDVIRAGHADPRDWAAAVVVGRSIQQ